VAIPRWRTARSKCIARPPSLTGRHTAATDTTASSGVPDGAMDTDLGMDTNLDTAMGLRTATGQVTVTGTGTGSRPPGHGYGHPINMAPAS